jgi:hypothetical protein
MISNEAVQILIATDRETLIALMAAAMAAGSWGGQSWNIYQDPDIRSLMDAARAANARPATLTPAEGWIYPRERRS